MKWIILLSFIPILGIAQETAFFETTIYFEDAIGNTDSLIVGHDEKANHMYNPEFGEMDIVEPWDSVFEVRAAHHLDWHFNGHENILLSKKVIGNDEGEGELNVDCLYRSEAIIFFINSINYPITISWKIEDFNSSICRNRSHITLDASPWYNEFWYEFMEQDKDYSCIAERDSFILSSLYLDNGFEITIMDEIEGSGIQEIHGILLSFRYQYATDTPCSAVVSVNNLNSQQEEINIFPNPSEDLIYIDSNVYDNWMIINQDSKLIKKGTSQTINVGEFQSGIYYLSLFDKQGRLLQTKKIVKME